jgi:tellurite resistance protein TerC
MFSEMVWLWIGFNLFVLMMLGLDLGIFHRNAHAVSIKEALIWSGIWIALAMLFDAGIFLLSGPELALQFLTGYLTEKSLSIDNIFVFVLLFTAFDVPLAYQHRVLFWGVLSALVMRGAMIALGVFLLETFDWILYLFGAFLIFTGLRMILQKETRIHPERNVLLKGVRRILPITHNYERGHFLVWRGGRVMATPLLLVLLVVETTDLIFALDSIPAIFAITKDPFIIYTSNVFALLGLRSLYFVFANMMGKFSYLKLGLAAVLFFVGIKMILDNVYHLSAGLSLLIITVILAIAIIASVLHTQNSRK